MSASPKAELSSTYSKLSSIFPPSSKYSIDTSWTLLAAAAVLAFGELTQERLQILVEILLDSTNEELSEGGNVSTINDSSINSWRLYRLRKFREALLKSGPIVGFPRSINALRYLQTIVDLQAPEVASVLKSDKSLRAAIPLSERQSRGRAFFDSVYAKHSDKILQSLNETSGGDLGEFAINCLYGDLIAEVSILDSKETAMLQFICNLSLGSECGPQAKGHMYGARNLGNTGEEIRAAINTVDCIASSLNVAWGRKDMKFLEAADEW